MSSLPPVANEFDSLAGASLPINYGTSYYALKRRANAQPGETVLVLGASGGIGTASIQLAHIMGLETICAVGSDEKEDYVKWKNKYNKKVLNKNEQHYVIYIQILINGKYEKNE